MNDKVKKPGSAPHVSLSFLVSQLGSHAAQCFARELTVLGLHVQDAGLLRMLGSRPGMTQTEIAELFGVLPSRLVVLIDRLEKANLVHRQRDTSDRRRTHIHLTSQGADAAVKIARLTRAMEKQMFGALSEDESRRLEALLRKVAADQELLPGVHPAFPQLAGEEPTGGGARPQASRSPRRTAGTLRRTRRSVNA
jgi:DNA-binding MarR family transcriptional regulator